MYHEIQEALQSPSPNQSFPVESALEPVCFTYMHYSSLGKFLVLQSSPYVVSLTFTRIDGWRIHKLCDPILAWVAKPKGDALISRFLGTFVEHLARRCKTSLQLLWLFTHILSYSHISLPEIEHVHHIQRVRFLQELLVPFPQTIPCFPKRLQTDPCGASVSMGVGAVRWFLLFMLFGFASV